jgi:hypothetical protein
MNWWTTPDVIFALKYAAASIVLWLPQVFRTTAFLMYSEKVPPTFQPSLYLLRGSYPASRAVC